ncbi:MAG: hypothetical protein RM049_36455 [Nostoc sp. DedQUE04]|uniref:hypothetical protein n=1 Tax=Nostoc sp. DedQUE04 TaxID=3075390 RepID=UPI002AD557A4|nr:hypothetical protein [Nostoc sp. DedQUE04]MDZ8140727.1 hypothetical protein [Nostoc sp. DedQUE04]
MKNQKIQQLSDQELLIYRTKNLEVPYTFKAGDESILSYSLVLSDKIPLTFSCKFSTSKLTKGIPHGHEIEICQVIVNADKVGIVIKNIKPLSEKARLTINVNYKPTYIGSHADVIIFQAIPHWMTVAASLVNSNQIAPSWLITVNLLRQLQFEVDTLWDTSTRKKFLPFSEDNYRMALIESAKQAPNNPKLLRAVFHSSEMYEKLFENVNSASGSIPVAAIEAYRELSSFEEIMNEITAEGRGYGGAK